VLEWKFLLLRSYRELHSYFRPNSKGRSMTIGRREKKATSYQENPCKTREIAKVFFGQRFKFGSVL